MLPKYYIVESKDLFDHSFWNHIEYIFFQSPISPTQGLWQIQQWKKYTQPLPSTSHYEDLGTYDAPSAYYSSIV